MSPTHATSWTMVSAAARGDVQARVRFTDLYLEIVRAYLTARWRDRPVLRFRDDAVQDVFLECFRAGGALDGVEREGGGAFRTFLYAVVRNVARRFEERAGLSREIPLENEDHAIEPAAADPTPSVAFDRAWAHALLVRARQRQRQNAHSEDAKRGVELLELRFSEGLGIAEIAARFGLPAERVHALYRKAREDFKLALREELAFHGPTEAKAVDLECNRLLDLLGAGR